LGTEHKRKEGLLHEEKKALGKEALITVWERLFYISFWTKKGGQKKKKRDGISQATELPGKELGRSNHSEDRGGADP